ncbi:DUF4124 domain-containing protein [Massilia agilis]
MKRQACQLCLILAAATAAPSALAGDILKCVDRTGHVTLTDQPCPPGTAGQRLVIQDSSFGGSGSAGSTGSGGDELPAAVPAMARYPAPAPLPPRGKWKPPTAKEAQLSRDAATLKAARMQLMVKENGQR